MLVRRATQNDQVEWLRMRSALWPDCALEDHYSEMADQLADPARYAEFVVERDTGQLGGFLCRSMVLIRYSSSGSNWLSSLLGNGILPWAAALTMPPQIDTQLLYLPKEIPS